MNVFCYVCFVAMILLAPACTVAQDSAQDHAAYQEQRQQLHQRWSLRVFQGHEEWLGCQTDSQCVIMTLPPPCSSSFAVNAGHLTEAKELAARKNQDCSNSLYQPPDIFIARCANSQCMLTGNWP